ncbi:ATP-binding protein [Streptomyces sp. NPDC002004]
MPQPLPSSAADARDQVEGLLREHFGRPSASAPHSLALTDALLVTSELVTNAIRHAGGVTGFTAQVTDDGLVVTVRDGSTATPAVRRAADTGFPPGGYGWPLVQRLALRVEIAPLQDGKSIRVLLPLAPRPDR